MSIDIDSTICEAHGYQKQGASFGYTRKRGYHPLLAARADTGEVLHVRFRKGSANTGRSGSSSLSASRPEEPPLVRWRRAARRDLASHSLSQRYVSAGAVRSAASSASRGRVRPPKIGGEPDQSSPVVRVMSPYDVHVPVDPRKGETMNKGGFSWKRLLGISAAKRRVSRATGIPWTRSGRQRKVGSTFWRIFK